MKNICIIAAAVLLVTVPVMLWAQADGAALFNEKCSMCHGAKGDGNKDMGMPAVKGTKMTAEQLTAFLLKGNPDNAVHANPMGQLNEEPAKAVAEFVKSLK
jgi:mono/diheme cytochrome c family protein